MEDFNTQQAELVNTVTEIKKKITRGGTNSVIQEEEKQISKVEGRLVEITDVEQNK